MLQLAARTVARDAITDLEIADGCPRPEALCFSLPRPASRIPRIASGDALFLNEPISEAKWQHHRFVKRTQYSSCSSETFVISKVEQTRRISPSCPSPVRPSWRNYPTGSCHQEAQSLGRAADQSDLSLDLSELAEHFSLQAFFCVCCQPLFLRARLLPL